MPPTPGPYGRTSSDSVRSHMLPVRWMSPVISQTMLSERISLHGRKFQPPSHCGTAPSLCSRTSVPRIRTVPPSCPLILASANCLRRLIGLPLTPWQMIS